MKKIKFLIKCVIVLFVFLFSVYYFFFDMSRLPEGDFISSSVSPNGEYRVDVYLFEGNATTDYGIRCAVVDLKNQESRNIYWQYNEDNVQIQWIDHDTVDINGKILNVLTDTYDWRNS